MGWRKEGCYHDYKRATEGNIVMLVLFRFSTVLITIKTYTCNEILYNETQIYIMECNRSGDI